MLKTQLIVKASQDLAIAIEEDLKLADIPIEDLNENREDSREPGE